MNTLPEFQDLRARDVHCSDDMITVTLSDGRIISSPLAWYPRLLNATAEQRANWQLNGSGHGIHWPDIDEDLSVEGIMQGRKSPGAA